MPGVSSLRKLVSDQDYGNVSYSVLNSHVNYLVQIDLQGTIVFVNQAYAQELDIHTEERYVGQLFQATVHPEDIDKYEQVSFRCVQNPGVSIPIELRKSRRDGTYFVTYWEFMGDRKSVV